MRRFFRPHNNSPPYVSPLDFHRRRGQQRGCRDGTRPLDDADDFVTDGAPTVVDFLLEDVDTLDEECSRVVYDLCITGGSDEYMLMLRIASTHIESSFESDHGK